MTNSADIAAAPTPPVRSLSTLFSDLRDKLAANGESRISVAWLVDALHERGIALLLLLFAAPMALPLPDPPGLNLIFALPMVILTTHQALGAHTVWLPGWLTRRTLSKEFVAKMLDAIIPALRKLEMLVKPRLGWLTQDGPSRLFGLFGLVMALTACLPVPLTHTVPSIGITLMAVGFTMRDGIAVIAGAVIGMAWIAILAAAVIFLGAEGFDMIRETIKSFL